MNELTKIKEFIKSKGLDFEIVELKNDRVNFSTIIYIKEKGTDTILSNIEINSYEDFNNISEELKTACNIALDKISNK